jgi:iron complex outermembrane receptor protein
MLHATEESMDALLNSFEQKSDLSHKTKIANAGNTIVITREELERMQVRNLKELINSLNLLNYAESRFSFTDPNYVTNTYPFSSNSIRVYIDNQEVSSSAYGSGLFYLGDIELGFVNHVEVYTINPSYEYATEGANFLIKLYSKIAERDSGTKVDVTLGTKGYNQKSIQYIDKIDGVSYLSYLSHLDAVRKKHESFGSPLSRDKNRLFLFNKISTEHQSLQFQVIESDRDAFMGISTDAITHTAKLDTDYYHLGYQNSVIDNLKLSAVLEKGDIAIDFKDNSQELTYSVDDKLATVDVQYKFDGFNKNDLIIGAKHRHKSFVMSSLFHEIMPIPVEYDRQTISSLYLENHYAFNPHWLFSVGAQIGKIDNNSIVENQDLWMSRVGLVYTNESWISKTFFHHSSLFAEPYLYLDTLIQTKQFEIDSETISSFTQEVSYENDKHTLRAIVGYNHKKDPLIIRKRALENSKESERGLFSEFDYRYQYNQNTLAKIGLGYHNKRNPATDHSLDDFKEYKAVVMLSNKLDKFDIYNRLIYNHNNFIKRDFFNYGMGIKYHYSDNFKLSLKGENILNKSREDSFERGRRDLNTRKWIVLEPLYISPIDQQIYLTMEYFF